MDESVKEVIVNKNIEGGLIWLVQINRPRVRNAVNAPTASALAEAFIAFEKDSKARVAILYGEGGNFCAGADLQGLAKGTNVNQLVAVPLSMAPEPSGAILDATGPMGVSRMLLSKPVIAAVSGYAVAGGLELASWCDLRVADETAVFGVFCRRFGVPLIDGGTARLPRLIGQSRAMDMILTGRAVSASEAHSFGLVNRLVDSKSPSSSSTPSSSSEKLPAVVQYAIEMATELANFPQVCMRSDRLSTIYTEGMSLRNALSHEFNLSAAAVSAEGVQGAKRFSSGSGRHGSRTSMPPAKL